MKDKKITIAIDGPSGSGKSTTAKIVAQKLGYRYIDSGAMYRAVTWHFLSSALNWKSAEQLDQGLSEIDIDIRLGQNDEPMTYLNGVLVERQIRSMPVSDNVSEVSSLPKVRKAMVDQQRKMGREKGVVMDGRDIGTNVFPDAELKIYLVADTEVRTKRRLKELREKGVQASLDEIRRNIEMRDKEDSSRVLNPLRKAADAIDLDSSNLSIQDQVNFVVEKAQDTIQRK